MIFPFTKIYIFCTSPRLTTSRPLGERSEPCLAAKRPNASNEVARGRLVSLDGFPFAFRAKNGEWHDSHLGFQVSFASPWLQWQNVRIPLRLNLLNVCVYLHHRRSKFVYFVRKLTSSEGRKKTKPCGNLESILGKEISQSRNPWHPHTFYKSTETFQYTHFSSWNPHGVRKGLIKGVALRLLRTNSSAKSFYENIYNFKKRLPSR